PQSVDGARCTREKSTQFHVVLLAVPRQKLSPTRLRISGGLAKRLSLTRKSQTANSPTRSIHWSSEETGCSRMATPNKLDVRFVIQPPASTALDKLRGLWDLVDIVTENNLIRAIVTWMSPMPFPFAETVALTDLQRAQLESLVRAGSTPQALVFRCRLILRAADRDHPTNLQIAAEFDCNRHTVAGWRNRYLSNGLAGLQDASRSGRPRRFSPSERLDLINLASSTTEQQGCPATRWSLDDLAATLINRNAHDLAMSRSTIWRILDEADLKPHRSVYWLNSHDPDFDAKAQEICKLYIEAPMMYQQGRLVICCDEKTGM